MKTRLVVASVVAALAPAAFAQSFTPSYDSREWREERIESRDDFRDRQWNRGRDTARVIDVKPISANQKEECWNPRAGHYEEVRRDASGNRTRGTAIGAVAGGVLGHQVDSGAGTVAGAVLGGLAGNYIERRRNEGERAQDDLDFSRCRNVAEAPAQGYEVRYEYRGQEYVTRMDHDPGRRLRVGEDIRPDGTPLDNVASYSAPAYSDRAWR